MESGASDSTSHFPSLRPHEALFAFIRPAKPLQPAVSPEQQQRRGDAPVCEDSAKRAAPLQDPPTVLSSSGGNSSDHDDNNSNKSKNAIPAELTGLFRKATPGTPLSEEEGEAPKCANCKNKCIKMRINQANSTALCQLVCTCHRMSGSVGFATTFPLPPLPSPRATRHAGEPCVNAPLCASS